MRLRNKTTMLYANPGWATKKLTHEANENSDSLLSCMPGGARAGAAACADASIRTRPHERVRRPPAGRARACFHGRGAVAAWTICSRRRVQSGRDVRLSHCPARAGAP